jgi:hypothetical protein
LVRDGEARHAPMKAMSRGRERDVALEYRAIARARSAGRHRHTGGTQAQAHTRTHTGILTGTQTHTWHADTYTARRHIE